MATVERKVKRGDSLVVIQGSVRLKVWALEVLTGADGAPVALSVAVDEILAGDFPVHIDELVINARGWDIYLTGDPSIPKAESPSGYSRLIAGLKIFENYGGHSHYVAAEHDVIYAGPKSEAVSEAHLKELAALGWITSDSDYDNFLIFV